MQTQRTAGIQLHRKAQRTTVRIDYQRLADCGKFGFGLKAGNPDWNIHRHSRTAA
jgi:hypothetical protein